MVTFCPKQGRKPVRERKDKTGADPSQIASPTKQARPLMSVSSEVASRNIYDEFAAKDVATL